MKRHNGTVSFGFPPLFTSETMPHAELQAAARDGDLICIDESFTPLDVPTTDIVRARSLRELTADVTLIAERETAAWVYGILSQPPRVHRFCVSIAARVRLVPRPRRHVREVVISGGEIVTIAGMPVTSLARTSVDILRETNTFTSETAHIVNMLLTIGNLRVGDIEQLLASRPRVPYTRRARERLGQLPAR